MFSPLHYRFANNIRTLMHPAVMICMTECGTNPPTFLLQTAWCGVCCLAHYNRRIPCVFRLILLATGEHGEAKDITCIKKPNSSSFQALPTFKGLGSWSQQRVTDSVPLGGGRQRTGVGRGWWWGLREAQPPLDKLELQTVETCEIRMEPSLLRCDMRDRAHSGSPCTVQLPRQTPWFFPLCYFGLLFFGQI